jgi:hypothetical protein
VRAGLSGLGGIMSNEKIKLPRSSYEELSKIIRAYASFDSPVSLSEVDSIVGIGGSNISKNNAFLVNVEILQDGKSKCIAEKGKALAKALDFSVEEDIRSSWQKIISENDFLDKMVKAVNIRKSMDMSQLINHIAYSAGEANTSPVLTGARAVVDILVESGFLVKENDMILPNDNHSVEEKHSPNKQKNDSELITVQSGYNEKIASQSRINVNINVQIAVNSNDLDGLGEKINQLIDEISHINSSKS